MRTTQGQRQYTNGNHGGGDDHLTCFKVTKLVPFEAKHWTVSMGMEKLVKHGNGKISEMTLREIGVKVSFQTV